MTGTSVTKCYTKRSQIYPLKMAQSGNTAVCVVMDLIDAPISIGRR